MTATKTMKILLISALLFVGVSGCGGGGGGGGDIGGGVALFNTVYVSKPQILSANPLLSDIAKWGGVEACSTTSYTVESDTADVSITVTAASTTITPSPVTVNSATVTFEPADNLTPVIDNNIHRVQHFPLGILIAPGVTKTIPIELVNGAMKQYIVEKMQLCATPPKNWKYYAKISFNLVENNTGESKSVDAELLVRFHDFVD
jgi:hypothetical protein